MRGLKLTNNMMQVINVNTDSVLATCNPSNYKPVIEQGYTYIKNEFTGRIVDLGIVTDIFIDRGDGWVNPIDEADYIDYVTSILNIIKIE